MRGMVIACALSVPLVANSSAPVTSSSIETTLTLPFQTVTGLVESATISITGTEVEQEYAILETALEDIAVYESTGDISGILPVFVKKTRSALTKAAGEEKVELLSDEEIIFLVERDLHEKLEAE